MQLPTLVRMANEIAAFFRAYPAEEAQAGIRGHIEAFWTPAMRAQLAAAEAPGLDPLAAAALRAPTQADNPAGKGIPSPAQEGSMASDAG